MTADKDALLRDALIMLGGIEETYSTTLPHETIREIDLLCDRITAALAEPHGVVVPRETLQNWRRYGNVSEIWFEIDALLAAAKEPK